MIYIKRLFIIFLLLSLSSGCAYFHLPSDMNKPTLTLVDLKLKKATLSEQTFVAELSIKNPNNFHLPVDNVKIELALEDRKLGEGASSQNFTVPANGEAQFKMKINANMMSNLMALKKIIAAKPKTIHYRLTGSLDIGSPLFSRDMNFETNDTIPAPNLKLQ